MPYHYQLGTTAIVLLEVIIPVMELILFDVTAPWNILQLEYRTRYIGLYVLLQEVRLVYNTETISA